VTDEQALFTAATFREWADDRQERDADVESWTGLVRDEQISRQLAIREMHHDPESWERPDLAPAAADGVAKNARIIRAEATDVARQALENGDMPTLKHMTGDTNQRADVSGIKAMGHVDDLVTSAASIIYIYAPPGTGKTDFGCLGGQRWKHHHPNGIVASNIRTLEETDDWVDSEGRVRGGWISDYGALDEWIRQDGEPTENAQTPKLFIFDEASSHADGSGKEGYETRKKLGPLVYKIRKHGGNLVIIGHDGGDVHPAVREQAMVVEKESKKRATIYTNIRNRNPTGKVAELDGVPPTDWRYDTSEPTSWSWEDNREDDEEQAAVNEEELRKNAWKWTAIKAKQQGLSNEDAAEYVPYSDEWVRLRWKDYQKNGAVAETVAEVEAAFA